MSSNHSPIQNHNTNLHKVWKMWTQRPKTLRVLTTMKNLLTQDQSTPMLMQAIQCLTHLSCKALWQDEDSPNNNCSYNNQVIVANPVKHLQATKRRHIRNVILNYFQNQMNYWWRTCHRVANTHQRMIRTDNNHSTPTQPSCSTLRMVTTSNSTSIQHNIRLCFLIRGDNSRAKCKTVKT